MRGLNRAAANHPAKESSVGFGPTVLRRFRIDGKASQRLDGSAPKMNSSIYRLK